MMGYDGGYDIDKTLEHSANTTREYAMWLRRHTLLIESGQGGLGMCVRERGVRILIDASVIG